MKDMDISTGNVLVAIINKEDAFNLELHTSDRIKIKRGKKEAVAALDISESKAVPKGRIGMFEELLKKLNAKKNDVVEISLEKKPDSLHHIKRKLNGFKLQEKEIHKIVEDIVNNVLTDVEISYFVSGCYINGLTLDETVFLTKAMIKTGNVLKLDRHPVIDFHCIGGVPGNRTTMIVTPILAAAGLTIPKTSSRAITSPSGTADTMEVLCSVSFTIEKIKKIVEKTGGCIVWGGAVNLAPADDRIINVETPLGIDAECQMLASIMAKKGAVSPTHLLIDLPVGEGAKIPNIKEAQHLETEFKKIANRLRIKTKVIATDGSQPIGNGIGPALEARDVLWVLKNDNRGPKELKRKSLKMAEIILRMTGKDPHLARMMLESGKAYEKMVEIIKAQQGKEIDPDKIKLAKFSYVFRAIKSGRIKHIENRFISKLTREAGAPEDKEAGIYLYRHAGDIVVRGEKILTIYSDNKEKLRYAEDFLKRFCGIVIS